MGHPGSNILPLMRRRGLPLLRAAAFFGLLRVASAHVVNPIADRLLPALGFGTLAHGHFVLGRPMVVLEGLGLAMSVIVSALLVRTEARGTRFLERINLGGAHKLRHALAGAVAAALLLAIVLTPVAAAGDLALRPGTAPLAVASGNLLVLGVLFVLVGLTEELTYRGYPLRALADGIGFWPAACVTSAWFGWGHFTEGDPLIGALGTALFALFCCASLRATGSLAFAIGFHTAWDFMQSAVVGVPDSSFRFEGALATTRLAGPAWLSGGIPGPEGSALYLFLLACMTAFFIRMPKAAGQNLLQAPRCAPS